MNAPTFFRRRALLSGLALATAAAAVAQVEPIVPPARRIQGLESARRLLAPVTPPAAAPNPFYSSAFDEALAGTPSSAAPADASATPSAGPVAPPAGPKGARDLLAAIAQSLKPGGYIVMGGVPSLSFGQKRVKPGGLLTVTFEGNEYTLEVVAIDRTNFTLRLNREEFTRPIK